MLGTTTSALRLMNTNDEYKLWQLSFWFWQSKNQKLTNSNAFSSSSVVQLTYAFVYQLLSPLLMEILIANDFFISLAQEEEITRYVSVRSTSILGLPFLSPSAFQKRSDSLLFCFTSIICLKYKPQKNNFAILLPCPTIKMLVRIDYTPLFLRNSYSYVNWCEDCATQFLLEALWWFCM